MEESVNKDNLITRTNLGVIQSTAEEMDERRKNTAIVDYLHKLDEARDWVSKHIRRDMNLQEFLEELPKGEWLAEIAKQFDKTINQRIYKSSTREYLHTDNINLFITWLMKIKLSRYFFFEVIDLYESKNIPKVVYCIHGLAHFLNARGITNGIEKRRNVVFTQQDADLIANDIANIESHKYDEIQNNLDSDDYLNDRKDQANESIKEQKSTFLEVPVEPVPEETLPTIENPDEIIRNFSKSYVLKKSFELLTDSSLNSLTALKKYIALNYEGNADYIELLEVQKNILKAFKLNYKMQNEADSILRSARLLLENQAKLRNVQFEEFPTANDYRYFKRALYTLITDPDVLYKILSNNYELPLRTLFPDSTVGDYFFSRFIEYNIEYERSEMKRIAASHFMTSSIFSKLNELFITNDNFDLNPINISESIYKKLPDVCTENKYNKKSLLDEAITDKNVRDEIVLRSQRIIDFITPRINYIKSIDFPYYVKLFAGENDFFETFIEPSILLSNNLVVCELLKYIFYSKDLFENQTRSFDQERLFYYNCKFDKTSNFDFSDYSPLKEFLDSEEHRSLREDILSRCNVPSVTEYFVNCTPDAERLQVEISLEEVNSIIIILKKNIKVMKGSMKSLVDELYLLRQKPFDAQVVSCVKSDLDKCSQAVDVVVDGASATPTVNLSQEDIDKGVPNLNSNSCSAGGCSSSFNTSTHNSSAGSCSSSFNTSTHNSSTTSSCNGMSDALRNERFVLKLDTQYLDLNDESSFALDSLIKDVKLRILFLISVSDNKEFIEMLHTTSDLEYKRAGKVDLDGFKKVLVEDLEFLESKRIVSKENSYKEILDMIVYDLLKKKFNLHEDELSINNEVLDALFKRGQTLKLQLREMYSYLGDLAKSMCINKSGLIFNRQHGKKTTYGSYKYDLAELKPKIHENIKNNTFEFTISMDDPLVLNITVLFDGAPVFTFSNLRFDELLRFQEDGILYFEAGETCSLNASALIDLVNRQYIKY